MNLQAYNFYFPSFQTSTSTFRWVTGYLKKGYFKIALKIVKNGLSLGPFFLEIFYRTPPIFLQNLKALEMSFSKLVLHAQNVHILRDLGSFKVCLWKTNVWMFPFRRSSSSLTRIRLGLSLAISLFLYRQISLNCGDT